MKIILVLLNLHYFIYLIIACIIFELHGSFFCKETYYMGNLLLFSGGLFLICLVSSVFENWVEWHVSHWFEFI